MAFAGIREMNSKGFWKPPGYGKSREIPIPVWEISFPGNRQISGTKLRKCLQKSADFWKIGKSLGFEGKIRKFLGNFWGKLANFREMANFLEMPRSPQKFISRERPSGIREMISREMRSGIRDKSLRDTTLVECPDLSRAFFTHESCQIFIRVDLCKYMGT